MLDDEVDVPTPSKKKLDKSQLGENVTVALDGKKSDKSDAEDPKPRIVLTFRSEKTGSKNSNMKIVSSEEKHEEFSPRRSSRTRNKWEWTDEDSISPNKRDKSSVSENDEVSDSSIPKRSSRRRSKDSSDNVLANAIARKEKSYSEAVPTQRLSRRIKPTAKVLENEELRIGVESQNNARLGIQPEKEEGVRTRRSARPAVAEQSKNTEAVKKESTSYQDDSEKLRHLCELGLKVKEPVDEDAGDNRESEENECEVIEDEEIDDDSEVISKLLEADDETISEVDDDEDFSCSEEASQTAKGPRTRRSTRLNSSFVNNDSDDSTVPDDDKTPPRRSSRIPAKHLHLYMDNHLYDDPEPRRKKKARSSARDDPPPEPTQEEDSNPAGGDEGSEAACPEDDSAVVATCYCTTPSNVHADDSELTVPVFCQAIETVDGARIGCSHGALQGPLRRAGPRAPFLLTCALHAALLARHVCCPACGLFCTQGIFYQCSEKHLFHPECGLPYNDVKSTPGCPHCGVKSYRWTPANTRCVRVKVDMKCSNKRVLLSEQRQQCTPAYLSFSTLPESQTKQEIPIPDELKDTPIDLETLKMKVEKDDLTDEEHLQRLKEAIVAKEPIDVLAARIASVRDINAPVDADRSTCAHIAALTANSAALYLLAMAGGRLDDTLLAVVQALLDRDGATKSPKHLKDSTEDMEVDQTDEQDDTIIKDDSTIIVKDEIEKTDEIKEEIEMNLDSKQEEMKIGDQEVEKTQQNNEVDMNEEVTEEPIDTKEIVESVKETNDKPVEEEKETEDAVDAVDEDKLFDIIRWLVVMGHCDVDFPGPEGMTALHTCAAHGGPRAEAIAAMLLDTQLSLVDVRDHGGWTPLVWAAEHGHVGMTRLLLQYHADATAKDKEGNGVIHWCALAGHAACLTRLLIAAPSIVDHCNQHGDTPLHIATRHGHYSCVVILLARGARTDVTNAAGETPLAACGEHEDCRSAIALSIHMNKTRSGRTLLSADISRGREPHPLPLVNEVDDAPAPDFRYVTSHVMTENIVVDNTISTLQGCSCKSGSCTDTCACSVLSVRRWYCGDKLHPAFSYREPPMLFECNCTCGCNETECGNNVVTRLTSRGSLNVRACVFRGRAGWGLRAREHIPRGSLVAVYCGELLTLDTADARVDDQYMFALDVKPDLLEQCLEKTMLCVDAAKYGSAARFINHSCVPNLVPVRVFTSTRDLRLPTIALFSSEDINSDDELTFDYGEKFWSVKIKFMKCECGTAECRYPEIKEDDEA